MNKRTILIAAGIGAIVVLLAAATFLGAQLLKANVPGGEDVSVVEEVSDDGKSSSITSSMSFDMERASELPKERSTLGGVVVRREDNSLFVGTGNIIATGGNNPDTGEIEMDFDGPIIEVVITHDTKIFRDVTFKNYEYGDESPAQQVLEPGSLEEIGKYKGVSVWGEYRGDRVIASVLSYY